MNHRLAPARSSRPLVLLVLSVALGGLSALPAVGQSPPALDLDRLEAVADSVAYHHIATGGTPGLTVAVARDGQVVFARGYGQADVENGVAARPGTVYRIGSITKQYTAAIIMRLVEAGELSLDDPITRFLPDFDTQGHTVLVRHLLNHTSGIKSYTGLGEEHWRTSFRLDLGDQELIDLFEDEPFDFAPGERQSYNNSAYFMLGTIIEAVTGVPYARHLEESLLEPLGLEHTLYCDTKRVVSDRAQGYEYEDGALVNADFLSMNVPGAAGAMCATVGDLVAWTRMLHDGEVVSEASLRTMTTPTLVGTGDTIPYGFGLAMGELEGHRRVAHGGGINGFISALAHFPDDGVTVAVLTNSGSAPADRIGDVLSRTALGLPITRVEDRPLPAESLARYTGTYRLELGERTLDLAVFEQDGVLMARAEGQEPNRLRWQGGDTFVPTFDDAVRLVFEIENGRATGVILHQGGEETTGRRIR